VGALKWNPEEMNTGSVEDKGKMENTQKMKQETNF